MRITVRPIGVDDFPTLSRFFADNNVLSITRKFYPFPLTGQTAFEITQKSHKDRYYLAFMGETVVGLAMLRGWDEGYEVPSFGVLVDRRFHNRGIGKKLTRFALAEAKILGCRKVRLSVLASNASALHIYASLGFKETDRTTALARGEAETKIVMEKELDQ